MKKTSVHQLLDRFDGFLLDAYGVLVDSRRPLPGANDFLRELERRGKPYRIISNDGSTTPEAKLARWAARGLQVNDGALLTPWTVLGSCFSPLELSGRKGFVLGTALSEEMFRRAGGIPVTEGELPEVLLVADEMTPDFMARCDLGLTLVVDAFRQGMKPELVLVNPDLVYPSGQGYGFTAGAICLMFEAALERLLGREVSFTRVGKPGTELFEMGLEELGLERERVVMLGDQWATDVAGARAAGLASVLLTTGLGEPDPAYPEQMILESLVFS